MWKAAEHRRRTDRAEWRFVGIQRCSGAGHQAGGEGVVIREAVAVYVELAMGDAAIAVGVERQRLAGYVGAGIHQRLGEAVPAAYLVARVIVVHAAELQLHAGAQIHVERRLQQRLVCIRVLVVAAGVLAFRVEPIAEVLVANAPMPAHFNAGHGAAPATQVQRHGTGGFVDELSRRFDAGRFRIEVQVAADFGWPMDRRCRPAHDVHAFGCADGRGIVAGVVESPDAAKVHFATRTADVERSRDAEEGLGEGTRHQGDQAVDVANVEARHQFVAHRGGRTRRLGQGLFEARERRHVVPRQAVQVASHHQHFELFRLFGQIFLRGGGHAEAGHEASENYAAVAR